MIVQAAVWAPRRGAPGFGGRFSGGRFYTADEISGEECELPFEVTITSLRSKQPIVMSELNADLTVGELKQQFARKVHCSARKEITLRLYGGDLTDDAATLSAARVHHNAALQAAFRSRKPHELEPYRGSARNLSWPYLDRFCSFLDETNSLDLASTRVEE